MFVVKLLVFRPRRSGVCRFFCVGFMPRTTNNSLVTTMFEGDSEVVPSSGADVVSSAGSSVLQAGQNISTSSDALAQAMSKR